MSDSDDEENTTDKSDLRKPEEKSKDRSYEGVSPSEAFSALGNEVRVNILRELGEIEDVGEVGRPSNVLSFSELYDSVGAKNTSQFSYHLDQLRDKFIQETDDGYRLTYAGMKVVRAILSGTYNERPEFGAIEIDGYCPVCENDILKSNYDNGMLFIECEDCGTPVVNYFLSPGQIEGRTSWEALRSFEQKGRHDHSLAVHGTCPECSGKMSWDVHGSNELGDDDKPYFTAICQQCNQTIRSPVDVTLVHHPAVVSFYWDHGINLNERPLWKLFEDIYDGSWEIERLSENPYEFRVTITLEEDELELRVDENLSVEDVRTIERR